MYSIYLTEDRKLNSEVGMRNSEKNLNSEILHQPYTIYRPPFPICRAPNAVSLTP